MTAIGVLPRLEALAAHAFGIPPIRNAILSFSASSTLASCSTLDTDVLSDAIKWLYLDVDSAVFGHLAEELCDERRLERYRSAVKVLRMDKPRETLESWVERLDVKRLRRNYPNLQNLEVGVARAGVIGEARLVLRTEAGPGGEAFLLEEARVSSLAGVALLPSVEQPGCWRWALRGLEIGREFENLTLGSDELERELELDAGTLDRLMGLPLQQLVRLRLSGFCIDAVDLLPLLATTPNLEYLEFYGGSTEVQLNSMAEGGFDPTNGILAAKITSLCPSLRVLHWHQCSEHPSNDFVLGCVQGGIDQLESIVLPWHDSRPIGTPAQQTARSARWMQNLVMGGVPWKAPHSNLMAVELQYHPANPFVGNAFDLAVSLLLDFPIHTEISLAFRPSRYHKYAKRRSREGGSVGGRDCTLLMAKHEAVFKQALDIRQTLIAAMPREGFVLVDKMEQR